jgi:ABC-type polysaccharide/polyol phosphate export permease
MTGIQIPRLEKASRDLISGLYKPSVWWALAWLDVKQRYRRSLIGPFWITASTGVLVGAMGPLYGALLGQDTASYLPYLATSLVLWSFISTPLNEAGTIFAGAETYIRQVPLPLSTYIFRSLARNALILLHNALVILVVLVILPPEHFDKLWLLPLGLLILIGNLFWLSLLLAIAGSRFRDVPQLVSNLVQLAFFLSPILWKPDMLQGRARSFVDFNPLYHMLEIVRAPLLGSTIRPISWIATIALLLAGSLVAILAFAKFRSRIPYWL